MNLKKIISEAVAGILILSSLSVFAISTYDFDNGIEKGIDYFNNGLYYEARDEFRWFYDANWEKMNEGQKKYVLDYINAVNEKIQNIDNSTVDFSSFIDKYIKKITEFSNGNEYVKFTFGYVNGDNIPDAIVSTSDSHVGAVRFFVSVEGDVQKVTYESENNIYDGFGQYGQAKYVPYGSKIYSRVIYMGEYNNYYQINGNIAVSINDSCGDYISTPKYKDMYPITSRNIKDVFNKTIENNKGESPLMSDTTYSSNLSTSDFDIGMSKGIEYFNKGMYYEARDEFQWFCDANWGKMNAAQQKYALDYLGGAKQKIHEWEESQRKSALYYYSGTDVPTYTCITGVPLNRYEYLDSGVVMYVYKNYTGSNTIANYWNVLASQGWVPQPSTTKAYNTLEVSFIKGSSFIIIDVVPALNEIWIACQ